MAGSTGSLPVEFCPTDAQGCRLLFVPCREGQAGRWPVVGPVHRLHQPFSRAEFVDLLFFPFGKGVCTGFLYYCRRTRSGDPTSLTGRPWDARVASSPTCARGLNGVNLSSTLKASPIVDISSTLYNQPNHLHHDEHAPVLDLHSERAHNPSAVQITRVTKPGKKDSSGPSTRVAAPPRFARRPWRGLHDSNLGAVTREPCGHPDVD